MTKQNGGRAIKFKTKLLTAGLVFVLILLVTQAGLALWSGVQLVPQPKLVPNKHEAIRVVIIKASPTPLPMSSLNVDGNFERTLSSNSYSYSYYTATTSACSDSCSEEVVAALYGGDQDASCNEDLSCASECWSENWVDAHCACDTGALFSSFSYEFAGSEAYCCSNSSDCEDAVLVFYKEILSDLISNETAIVEYLEQQCSNVNCSSNSSSSSSSATPSLNPTEKPVPSPTKLPAPDPTKLPLPNPSALPVPTPTELPIPAPTLKPIKLPIHSPTKLPVLMPTEIPVPSPTHNPMTKSWWELLLEATASNQTFSYDYSMGYNCFSDCGDEVLAAIGDQDALCALNSSSCVNDCFMSENWVEAHCLCNTGELFAIEFSFDGSEEYCCGDINCQASVANYYESVLGEAWNATAGASFLKAQCSSVDCSTITPQPTLEVTETPTPVPSTLPTAADTVVISVSFELTAYAEPTNSDKTYLKTRIASALGVDEGNLKGFTVVSSLARRLSNTLLRQRRDLLATYTWTASFDLVVSLAATTSSSSSDLVSFVATALTDSSFVSDIVTELGAAVDTSTVVAVRITRQPTAAPATPPTAAPVAAGSTGGTSNGTAASTVDANSTGAKEAASPIIGIVIGLLGACVFAVATSYFIYRRYTIKDGDNHDLNTIRGDKSSAVKLKPLKKEHAPSIALNLQSVAVQAVSMEVADFVDGSVKEFLFAQAKITSAKRLEELVARFKEYGFKSVEDFRGMGENELTDAFLKGKIDLNASEIRSFKAVIDASKVSAFKAINVTVPLGTQI